MYHCCQFKAEDIYYLKDTNIYSSRKLSIGFCPICEKPVAELTEWSFMGAVNKVTMSGINAHNLVMNSKDDIIYSMKNLNYKKLKMKPYGWKFGINRQGKTGKIRQYACDFFGNKELIKTS